jgi:uncharacterized phage protein (TIGR02218 family)
MYAVQLLDLAQALNRTIGRTVTPFCDAVFGDARCTVDATSGANQLETTVASLDTDHPFQTFTIAAPGTPYDGDDFFTSGVATFTSGANSGRRFDVIKHTTSANALQLLVPLRRAIEVGDGVTLTRGCAHTLTACIAIQGDAYHFRGFPHKPSPDKYLQFGFLLTGQR